MVAGGLRQEPTRRKQVRFAAAELIENGRGTRALRDWLRPILLFPSAVSSDLRPSHQLCTAGCATTRTYTRCQVRPGHRRARCREDERTLRVNHGCSSDRDQHIRISRSGQRHDNRSSKLVISALAAALPANSAVIKKGKLAWPVSSTSADLDPRGQPDDDDVVDMGVR